MRGALLLALWMTSQTLTAGGFITGAGSALRVLPRSLTQIAGQLEMYSAALRLASKGLELALLVEEKHGYIEEHGATLDRIENLKNYELQHFQDDADVTEQQKEIRSLEYFIELIKREPGQAELNAMVTELEAELEAELEKIRNR